ncbi:MAG: zinc ribbon domain-containing protein [Clostridia bacterium]|nr:zinc ribbon domain-containing protein [Clostridia bacterium]
MITCKQCGAQMPENVNFCTVCGASLSQSTQQEASVYPPQPEQPQTFEQTYAYNTEFAESAFDYSIPAPKKSKKGLLWGLIGGGIGLIALVLILCLCLCGGTSFGASKESVKSDLESKGFLCARGGAGRIGSTITYIGNEEDLSADKIVVDTVFNAEDEMFCIELHIDERVSHIQPFIEKKLGLSFARYDRYGYEDEGGDERYVWVAENDTIKCSITYDQEDDEKTTTVSIYNTEYIIDTEYLDEINEMFDAYVDERSPNYD